MPAFKVISSVPRLRHLKMQCPSFPSVRVRESRSIINVSSDRFFWGLPFYLKEPSSFSGEVYSLSINAGEGNCEKGTSRIHTSGDRPIPIAVNPTSNYRIRIKSSTLAMKQGSLLTLVKCQVSIA